MAEFQDCIDNCELLEMVGNGSSNIWYNNQEANPITRKLDRCLTNEAWFNSFPQSTALYDDPCGSDHTPILVSTSNERERRKVPFKFYNLFTSHPDYPALIQNAWNNNDHIRSPMYRLCQNLKAVKMGCKTLNRTSFSNIQARTAEVQEELKRIQTQILTSPSQQLFQQEKQVKKKWLFLSTAEESFLKQKSRIRWYSEGDSNTMFFHNSVKAHQARNKIGSLLNDQGERITEKDQLKI
ncbi:PREDICTED: uncharacterized protein LOC104737901 [Camelina sativa]|uniref:Uncharacterized protein LOC104737901 n=1 Tax=Camelina sativa TaxID=90675 RepID=A0ABM0VI01_CAMSA|nr:PREDICTED: uncharacterized protein LOC104737901 [Camelina sativa]